MATEAQYNKAKEEWLDAAKDARGHMESSKERHNWENWVPQNDPVFANKWNEFQQKAAAFQMAMKHFDSAKAEAWEKAYSQLYIEKYHGAGEDKGSNCLIITPEV